MWRQPNDPTLLGITDVEFTAARAFIARYNALFGSKITPTHLTGRAAGLLAVKYPEANAFVGTWNILLRQSADVFFAIASENGRNLSGRKIEAIDRLSLAEIAQILGDGARAVRAGNDATFGKGHDLLRRLPFWLARPVVRLTGFLNNRLGLDLSWIGAPRDAYGGVLVTSLGPFGFETGFAAMFPLARNAFMIALMEVRDKPWVVEDRVEPRPVLRICCTTDHRIVDGYFGGLLLRELKELLLEPERLLTEDEQAIWASSAYPEISSAKA